MSIPRINLKRRWKKARPGSVLILVIALLVLLALIGTAYLSSTQTERYSSQQNSVNTEADLLVQGVIDATNSAIANALFGSTSTGLQYRPAGQEMPTYVGFAAQPMPAASSYNSFDSASTNVFQAARWPDNTGGSSGSGVPFWSSVSFPLFPDGSGDYSFDSPFDASTNLYLAANKAVIEAFPTYRTINGQLYPAMLYFVPSPQSNPTTLQMPNGQTYNVPPGGVYLTPMGVEPASQLPQANTQAYNNWATFAASASGDGIADGGMFKLPVGPINNITYYADIRVIDNNSAINASSAWTVAGDPNSPTTVLPNYGFFPTGIGLQELLYQTPPVAGSPGATQEMAALNTYRFSGQFVPATPVSASATPGLYSYPTPTPDTGLVPAPPSNFNWYSYGDALYTQLIRRPGNPGTGGLANSTLGSPPKFAWLGLNQSAAIAYHFSLINPNASPSYIEQLLPNELYTGQRSTPYSPAQTTAWFSQLFANQSTTGGIQMPMRTCITCDNATSNAVQPRYKNASSAAPVPWATNTNYNFGDWVVDSPGQPGSNTVGVPARSFVCIRAHNSGAGQNKPQAILDSGSPGGTPSGYNQAAVGYWAGAQGSAWQLGTRPPGLPWYQQPVKASVNTATFEDLWLAFAQVMTDSIGVDNQPQYATGSAGALVQHWQPPMQAQLSNASGEQQLPMFRSPIRDPKAPGSAGRVQLTAAQVLKLRAALAAINAVDDRDSDDDVTSRHIVLDDSAGNPQYDVEVYGTEMQPYITEMVLQSNGTTTGAQSKTYFAIELCNPYNKAIKLDNWQFGFVNRGSFPTLTMSPGLAIPAGTTIPAAANGLPGILVLYDYQGPMVPTDIATTISDYQTLPNYLTVSSQPVQVPGLALQALGVANQPNEVYVMRPRRADNQPSRSTGISDDRFDESQPSTMLADYVPVDQIDLTGLKIPATTDNMVYRYDYRRGSDSTAGKAWNFVYPGYYDPGAAPNYGRYFNTGSFNSSTAEGQATAAMQLSTIPDNQNPNGPPAPPLAPCNLGGADGGASVFPATVANPASTYNTVPIELNNLNMAGPNRLSTGTTFMYPFGGFARNADMLQIPFIGAYRIRPYVLNNPESNNFTEINSVTMDSALANDTSAGTSALPAGDLPNNSNATIFNEQIGRFCPLGNPTAVGNPAAQLDFGPGYMTGAANQNKIYWHYHWTRKLFDYLTVEAPHDDYYPNVDPTQADISVIPNPPAKYPPGTAIPTPVANTNANYSNALVATNTEDTTGIQGLVNINTAPLPVLASLPFTNPYVPTTNLTIAQGIIAYRNVYGPFKSIMDLYNVPAFFQAQNTAMTQSPAGPTNGVFSPNGIGTNMVQPALPQVRYDFQERFLLLNNISNLITTRSDSFTCYVLLQGWRNAGTGNATLAVERRAAFIVDRNGVTPSNNKAAYFPFPSH